MDYDPKEAEKIKARHKTIKAALKIAGPVFIAGGLVFMVIGMVDFFSSMGTFDPPTKFWMLFIGMPLLFVGLALTLMGFRREMMRYQKNETMPVFTEMSGEIRPAVQNIVSAAKSNGKVCRCGKLNDAGAVFCNSCGEPLAASCPECGAANEAGASFCNKCRAKLK